MWIVRRSSFCESEIDLEVTKSVEERLMVSLRSVFQNREQVIGVQLHQWRGREKNSPKKTVKLGLISRLRERVSAVGWKGIIVINGKYHEQCGQCSPMGLELDC